MRNAKTVFAIMTLLLVAGVWHTISTRAQPLAPALLPSERGPFIFVYPGSFDVTHTNPPETTFDILTVENSSSDFVSYSLHTVTSDCEIFDAPAWLFVSSGGGTLPPFSVEQLQVQFSSDGLVNGVYNALICVRDTSHPQNPYHLVFVQLTVAAPATETPTPEPPTATPEAPTATPEPPTATPEEPTATPEPPTATPEEPTATPELPTATPEPPTATAEPPTPSNTPPPGATLTPTVPPSATPTRTNTPPPGASLTPTALPAANWLYLPIVRRR